MIRMVMGYEYPLYRPAPKVGIEQRIPDGLAFRYRRSGIHQRPTITVLQEPDIDLSHGKRQRQTHPEDPVLQLGCCTRRGDPGIGIHQFLSLVKHVLWASIHCSKPAT